MAKNCASELVPKCGQHRESQSFLGVPRGLPRMLLAAGTSSFTSWGAFVHQPAPNFTAQNASDLLWALSLLHAKKKMSLNCTLNCLCDLGLLTCSVRSPVGAVRLFSPWDWCHFTVYTGIFDWWGACLCDLLKEHKICYLDISAAVQSKIICWVNGWKGNSLLVDETA